MLSVVSHQKSQLSLYGVKIDGWAQAPDPSVIKSPSVFV